MDLKNDPKNFRQLNSVIFIIRLKKQVFRAIWGCIPQERNNLKNFKIHTNLGTVQS